MNSVTTYPTLRTKNEYLAVVQSSAPRRVLTSCSGQILDCVVVQLGRDDGGHYGQCEQTRTYKESKSPFDPCPLISVQARADSSVLCLVRLLIFVALVASSKQMPSILPL